MWHILKILQGIILLLFLLSGVLCDKYNVSLAELHKCKQYNAVNGYGYKQFFKIEDLHHTRQEGDMINLHLAVLAAKDAHILLSPNNKPTATDALYEIVLGAGSNTFCEIRRKMKQLPLNNKRIPYVLSAIEPTPLNIRITTDGYIEVKIDGASQSLITANDPNPVQVKYLSFTSWGSAEGKWFYDCPNAEGDEIEEPSESPPTTLQLLRNVLFDEYDFDVIPDDLTYVNISLQLKRIMFHTKESYMESRVVIKLNWTDPKMAWSPEEFDAIETFKAEDSVWTPNLFLLNGHGPLYIDLPMEENIININYDSQITSVSREIILKTWCSDSIFKNWPSDELLCEIKFGLFPPHIRLRFGLSSPDNIKYANLGSSGWHIVKMITKEIFVNPSGDTKESDMIDLMTGYGYPYTEMITYQIHLKRNENFIDKLFVTPLIVGIVFIMISLWTDEYMRILINLLGTILLVGAIMLLVTYAPTNYVPTLMYYYQITLVLSWISLVLFIINIWMIKYPPATSSPSSSSSSIIITILNTGWIRLIFGLGATNMYSSLQTDEKPWEDMAKLLDRIFFFLMIIYSLAITIRGY